MRYIIAAIGLLLALPAYADPPTSVLVTQTVDTLAAATDKALTGTGPGIRMLCIQNIDTGLVNLAFDVAATAGAGYALNAAAGAGQGGGSICWSGDTVPRSVVHAISTAGSKVAVVVGR